MHTAEPGFVEVKIYIEMLGRYKSPCTEEIPAELIQAGGILRSTDLLILFQIVKNCQCGKRNVLLSLQ
jgi:hypothetical protein